MTEQERKEIEGTAKLTEAVLHGDADEWRRCKAEVAPKDGWHTPPRCQGQIVLVSYSSGEDGVIYRRTWDQSDGTRIYSRRLLADDELFEPWQEEPR